MLLRYLLRAGAAAAVALTLGATACGGASVTGPQASAASASRTDASRLRGTAQTSGAKRRAGYNVVAD